MKKPICVFTIAGDQKNLEYASMLEKTFHHFHPDIPFIVVGPKELEKNTDPQKFYRATPYYALNLLKDFDLVIKMDADQLILGNLDYVFKQPYDVGCVLNINRVDPQRYGLVQGWGIQPNEYMNCGFVAMRSTPFVEHWLRLCMSPRFDQLQYKEQDLLNILYYYGNYKTLCFDHYNALQNYSAYHGLVAKGEGVHAVLRDGKVIIPRGQDNYPDKDVELKAYHWAGGKDERKMDYQKHFSEEIIEYIDGLLK